MTTSSPCSVLLPSLVTLVLIATSAMAADAPPQRLSRADSFLGIHFDFHAGPDCKEVGKNTTPAMIENIIDLVHPDYLQIDCKGHPGFSSYPTKVGQQAPGIIGDPLRVWREVTAKRGVALYMHYSGVYDKQCTLKPGWAAINADGKPNKNSTSFFGPYVDQLMIPQLRELAGVYGIDGVWVDGDCWAAVPDYCPAALAAFEKATGIKDVPRKPADPKWREFLDFHRDAYRTYLRHFVTEVKRTNPSFQICSNWAFSDHMAEPVCAPVDFLSGDYSPENSVNSARLSARYLVRQGKPWDLMAWSFAGKPKRAQKTAVQLEREAAIVLAQGGGFQAYFTQRRDGSVVLEQMPVMAEVAKFCRARQAICHHALPVPQVGLLLSTADQYHRINGPFSRDLVRIQGILQALVEGQQSVELLGEHQLAGRLAEYPIIVVPECQYLDAQFRKNLIAYVKAGGNLLLVGPSAARLFESELGLQVPADAKGNSPLHLAHAGSTTPIACQAVTVALGKDAKPFGTLHESTDSKLPSRPAATIATLGKGRIAATFFTAGQPYLKGRPELLRRFLNDLVRDLFPRPMVEVKGSGDVDVSVVRNQGKLLVNLVNTAGPHQTVPILESIPTVGPLDVTIRLPAKPAAVTLEPGARPVAFDFRDGQVHLAIPKLEIHDIVVVQTK